MTKAKMKTEGKKNVLLRSSLQLRVQLPALTISTTVIVFMTGYDYDDD